LNQIDLLNVFIYSAKFQSLLLVAVYSILTLLILYQIIYRSRCQRRNQGRCGRLLTAARQPEPNRLQWPDTPMDLQRQGRRLREIHLRRMLRNRESIQK
jgi:hypothetical protein